MQKDQQEDEKFFVLDTNVILHSAEALNNFGRNNVVIPITVVVEFDKFKTGNDELARNARHAARTLDAYMAKGDLTKGVDKDNGGKIIIANELDLVSGHGLDLSPITNPKGWADCRIIAVAYSLHKSGENTILISKDINVRIIAHSLGIKVGDFDKERVNFDELYTGYESDVLVECEVIDTLHSNSVSTLKNEELFINQYVRLVDNSNLQHSTFAKVCSGNKLQTVRRKVDNSMGVQSRNIEQRFALDLLLDPEIKIVSLIGQAGTGKTLLALASAMYQVKEKRLYSQISVSRPIIPMGKDLGYMPGDKDEKLSPWMQPVFDNLGYILKHTSLAYQIRDMKNDKEEQVFLYVQRAIEALLKTGVIELESLTHIRGRSLADMFIVVDEAQNLTPHEVKTIVSRVGEGSKIVLTGDPYQIDNPYLDASSNGLTYMVERLKGTPIYGHITLYKSERSDVAETAINLL